MTTRCIYQLNAQYGTHQTKQKKLERMIEVIVPKRNKIPVSNSNYCGNKKKDENLRMSFFEVTHDHRKEADVGRVEHEHCR